MDRHLNDNGEKLFYPDGVTEFSEEERYRHFDFQSLKYKIDRRNEYPGFIEYIDGIVKGDQDQVNAYIAACQAVKEKYPKPGG